MCAGLLARATLKSLPSQHLRTLARTPRCFHSSKEGRKKRGKEGREGGKEAGRVLVLLNKKDKLFQITEASLKWYLSFSFVVLNIYSNSSYYYVSAALPI